MFILFVFEAFVTLVSRKFPVVFCVAPFSFSFGSLFFCSLSVFLVHPTCCLFVVIVFTISSTG